MIEIRNATPADDPAMTRLAERDSARVPARPLLLALEDGEPRAALSLSAGETIADPFAPPAHLVAALRAYAAPRAASRGPRRISRPLRPEARLAG